MSDLSKQISNALEGMDPNSARAYLDDLRRDVLRAADQDAIDQAARMKELRSQTQDELTEDIARFNVRTGNRAEQAERMQVVREKQQLDATLAGMTSMPEADFQALETKRAQLVAEAESHRMKPSKTKGGRPSAEWLRIQEINQELRELPGNPDVVIPEKKPDEKVE